MESYRESIFLVESEAETSFVDRRRKSTPSIKIKKQLLLFSLMLEIKGVFSYAHTKKATKRTSAFVATPTNLRRCDRLLLQEQDVYAGLLMTTLTTRLD